MLFTIKQPIINLLSGVRFLVTYSLLTSSLISLSSCGNQVTPKPENTPSVEAKTVGENLVLEQSSPDGSPWWKIQIQKAVYTPGNKRGEFTKLQGSLYQDQQVIMEISAESGQIEQDGDRILLVGNVTGRDLRNKLIILGNELEYKPKENLLFLKGNVRGNYPQLQVVGNEATYHTKKQEVDLRGNVQAVSRNPDLVLKSVSLNWQVDRQIIKSDTPVNVQRYAGQTVTDVLVGNKAQYQLNNKTINVTGNVQIDSANPRMKINTESAKWEMEKQIVSSDRSIQINHYQEQMLMKANRGQVNLRSQIVTLTGNAYGLAQRNQAQLSANQVQWNMTSQEIIGEGNVIYRQINPNLQLNGVRGVGKLQDQSVTITGNKNQRVETEIIPNQGISN